MSLIACERFLYPFSLTIRWSSLNSDLFRERAALKGREIERGTRSVSNSRF
jgi:hypothetical protein